MIAGIVVGIAEIIDASSLNPRANADTHGGFAADATAVYSNSGRDGVGQTAGGKATDKFGNPLGPSGKPQINKIKKSSRKGAKDTARELGDGEPVNHPSPERGNPHYHPTGPDGEKVPGSPHVEYPQ